MLGSCFKQHNRAARPMHVLSLLHLPFSLFLVIQVIQPTISPLSLSLSPSVCVHTSTEQRSAKRWRGVAIVPWYAWVRTMVSGLGLSDYLKRLIPILEAAVSSSVLSSSYYGVSSSWCTPSLDIAIIMEVNVFFFLV